MPAKAFRPTQGSLTLGLRHGRKFCLPLLVQPPVVLKVVLSLALFAPDFTVGHGLKLHATIAAHHGSLSQHLTTLRARYTR